MLKDFLKLYLASLKPTLTRYLIRTNVFRYRPYIHTHTLTHTRTRTHARTHARTKEMLVL